MDQIETLIDSHASCDGKLTGKNVRIMGTYRGEIELSGRLHVADGARVEANVVADAAEIGGHFKGELKVRSVIVLEKGRVDGGLEAQSIAMREGALLNGPVNIGSKAAPAPKVPAAPIPPAEPAGLLPAGASGKTG